MGFIQLASPMGFEDDFPNWQLNKNDKNDSKLIENWGREDNMTESAGVSKKRFESWMKGNLLETPILGIKQKHDFIWFYHVSTVSTIDFPRKLIHQSIDYT